jgi:hypothetical protein
MEFHLFGATQDRQLWHTLAKLGDDLKFTSAPWGDVDVQASGHPGTGKVLDSACAMDGQGNLHVLVVTDEGNKPNRLWIAIRSQKTGLWMKFADVEAGSGAPAGSGTDEDIVAVTATTRMTLPSSNPDDPPKDLRLHIFSLTNKGRLFHAVWAPATGGDNPWKKGDGPTDQEAKWEKKFTLIKIEGRPGTFTTLETTSLR